MKLSLIQMNAISDKAANIASAASLIERAAAEEGPDWICLPECFDFLGGSPPPGGTLANTFEVVTQTSTAVANTLITIRGCWNGTCRTASANLNVVINPDFAIHLSPFQADVMRGGSTTYNVTATPLDGYTSSSIALS